MPELHDGPRSPLFRPLAFKGNTSFARLAGAKVSERMARAIPAAPRGACVSWGIPSAIAP